MTDEATERPAPATEPFELTEQDVDLVVQALRYLQSTLGREEAEEVARIQLVLAKLGATPSVGDDKPRY